MVLDTSRNNEIDAEPLMKQVLTRTLAPQKKQRQRVIPSTFVKISLTVSCGFPRIVQGTVHQSNSLQARLHAFQDRVYRAGFNARTYMDHLQSFAENSERNHPLFLVELIIPVACR
jgi:hypothetical protein